MTHDALAALRHTLLLSLGLGACTARPPDPRDESQREPPAADVSLEPPAAVEQSPKKRPRAGDEPQRPRLGPPPPPSEDGPGYVQEADGTVHRAGAGICLLGNVDTPCSKPGPASCSADDQCTAGPHPRCAQQKDRYGIEYCNCTTACTRDSDCRPGDACVCGELLGGESSRCVTAHCWQDSDCPGSVCGVSRHHDGCGQEIVLACRTSQDTCRSDADCKDPQKPSCAHDRFTSRWICQGRSCDIGRPLLVDDRPRTADAVPRDDWQFPLPDDAPAVSPSQAAALAAHWSEIAALEHASVASFARFTLELLAHGAPPALLAEAQQAALDELAHARLAYAIAGRFVGHLLGPGPLPTADIPPRRTIADIVAALVLEGCVGETLGAAELAALAGRAHPALADHLARVAADETRHAALAWRTLQWLLAAHGEPARTAAVAAFARAGTPPEPDDHTADDVDAPAWGLCSRAERRACHRAALAQVVQPLRAALLGPRDDRHSSHCNA